MAPVLLDPTDSFPPCRQTEGDKGASRALCELRVAGAMTYRQCMTWTLCLILCASLMSYSPAGQEPMTAATASAKNTTIIGCLSGPDADDLYTLTSMQHRAGVQVAGGDELKKGAGAKVKLTGSWETSPGREGKKGDATRRFKATELAVLEEKCQAPAAVTPQSKKKQQQQAQQQSQPK